MSKALESDADNSELLPSSASKQQMHLHVLGNRFAFIVSCMLMKGKIKKKKKGMKLSNYPSWVLMFHLLCWIFQSEKKNILKSCKPLTAFTCNASGLAWLLVPSLLPTKTAPPRLHQHPAGRKHEEIAGVPRKPLGHSAWHLAAAGTPTLAEFCIFSPVTRSSFNLRALVTLSPLPEVAF